MNLFSFSQSVSHGLNIFFHLLKKSTAYGFSQIFKYIFWFIFYLFLFLLKLKNCWFLLQALFISQSVLMYVYLFLILSIRFCLSIFLSHTFLNFQCLRSYGRPGLVIIKIAASCFPILSLFIVKDQDSKNFAFPV